MKTQTKYQSKRTRNIAFAAALAGVMTLGSMASQAHADEHMLVLIDQSGSMQTPSAASPMGDRRWDVARQLASDAVGAVAPDRSYALWTFSGSTFTQVVAFSDNLTGPQVQAIIDVTLPANPSGATPLAGSVCDAVDELINYLPSEFHTKRIELFSDGLENNTPNTHECWGPDSADHSNPDVGSWEWKVFNKAQTGNPNSAADPPIPLIVNADFLFDNESSVFSAGPSFAASQPISIQKSVARPRLPSDIIVGKVPGRIPGDQPIDLIRSKSPLIRSLAVEGVHISPQIIAAPHIEIMQSVNFYTALVNHTGGRYRSITPTTVLPQLGDVTGDTCVDDDDIDAISNNWGIPVGPGSLLDPNQDGTVNMYDYLTVIQNYGEGSGC